MHITTHAVDEQTNYDGCSNEFSQVDHPQEQTRMLPILKTEEIFHNCGVCCKEFCSRDDLQKHMRIHTGFKPFKCLICGEDFSVISSFKIHMRRHKEKGNNSSGHKGDDPSGHKGDNPSGHKGDNTSVEKGNNSSGHKGNNSSGEKGDNPSDLQV
ncbi:blast:Zinc finger protein 233 [Mytilus galloprovincialis]|uniref:Blast:Zinc finger protein 233 n=1 Tax=Mytilus galloprovincialis TaxID=29158 RepID=A0A8B6DBC6_MYTGA|nr:blast:Zinc finger protein 233 [Mytilus galloprovincialis]